MEAGNPNGEGLSAPGRTVAVRYARPSLLRIDARPPPGPRPFVAIAPVHQDVGDARVFGIPDPPRYGVEVLGGATRLREILDRAVLGKACLLFLPEMAVDEGSLADLGRSIRAVGRDHIVRTGQLPPLRYVVAGCVGRPAAGGRGRNFVVVLDHEGVEVTRQAKLTRWNLKPHHQFNYGLSATLDPGGDELLEDIDPGEEVWIADLPSIGRFATLVCADMSHRQPGDFLVRDVDLDWLHAPIMDRTNAPVATGAASQPWIVESAAAAAMAGARRVVVTNSMLFTALINVVNSRPGSAYAPYAACSIAFLVERRGGGLRFEDVAVPLSPASAPLSTVVRIVRWGDGFQPFPPP